MQPILPEGTPAPRRNGHHAALLSTEATDDARHLSPKSLQPDVAYGAAVVDGAQNPDEAKRFIDASSHGEGAAALNQAGFKPPPG